MMEPLITPKELAAYLKQTEKALAQWRYLGRGPRYLKLEGGKIRYRVSDVEQWLDEQQQATEEGQ